MDTLTVSLAKVTDFAALERDWRDLEARSEASFFQSWTWLGCLAARRYSDPIMLRASEGGQLIALGLFNRRKWTPIADTLWLGETGHKSFDDVYVEHNGLLIDRTAGQDVMPRCLEALLHRPAAPDRTSFARRLVLSGVGATTRAALDRTDALVLRRREQAAPRVEFASLPEVYLDALGQNTRYQIRRSDRRYIESGALKIERAGTIAQAHEYLSALQTLHQRTWNRRGKPGAFANPEFVTFHRALLDNALPRGEIDLLRISAGSREIGFLYSMVHRGYVSAYQSGFDYDGLTSHEKPGLTSHSLAIEHYRSRGQHTYDFLSGEDRYKTSMANASSSLSWLTVFHPKSLAARLEPLSDLSRRVLRKLKTRHLH